MDVLQALLENTNYFIANMTRLELLYSFYAPVFNCFGYGNIIT